MIKFDLIMDGCPVRNLDDVRCHFSMEDILKCYYNGFLARWLLVKGYMEELEAVESIDLRASDGEVLKELIRIFRIDAEEGAVDTAVGVLAYLYEERELYNEYHKDVLLRKRVIEDYLQGYERLMSNMADHKDQEALLRADIVELKRSYMGICRLAQPEIYSWINDEPVETLKVCDDLGLTLTAILGEDWWKKREKPSSEPQTLPVSSAEDGWGYGLGLI